MAESWSTTFFLGTVSKRDLENLCTLDFLLFFFCGDLKGEFDACTA